MGDVGADPVGELPLPAPSLCDGVVALRPWRDPVDLPTVEEAAADPAIVVGTTVPVPYTDQAGREWIARQHARRVAGTGLVLAVTDVAGGTVPAEERPSVGMVGLTGINPVLRSAELGYWLLARCRGRALSGRAAALLVRWALGTLPLVRIGARIEVTNVPSQRAAERAGLSREGVLRASFRTGDTWMDMAYYAVIRPGTPRATWSDVQSVAPSAAPVGSSRSDTELMQ